MKIISRNQPEQRKMFDELIVEKNVIKMLIFGNDKTIKKIAVKAENQEKRLEDVRGVIWIQSPDFLTEEEKKLFREGNEENVVCVLNMDNEPIVYLKKNEANSDFKLDRSFLKAQEN